MTLTETQIQTRGRMAYLMDEIKTLSRERDNLLRPLRERIYCSLPQDRFPSEVALAFDTQAAREELAAVDRAETRLAELVAEYNTLAPVVNQRRIKR